MTRPSPVGSASVILSGYSGLPAIGPQELKEAFNRARSFIRMLAVISPTCPECRAGDRAVRNVFKTKKSEKLRGFIVWIPMLPADTAAVACAQAGSWNDKRLLLQGWDAGCAIGGMFSKTLKLTRTAWDIYLIYAPGLIWEGELPPAPSFWMHQLRPDSGADQNRRLSLPRLQQEVNIYLTNAKRPEQRTFRR